MPELPNTIIGLMAFSFFILITGFGYVAKYLADKNKDTVDTFMTYIKEKNGNLERVSKEFSERMDQVTAKHLDAMESALKTKNKRP